MFSVWEIAALVVAAWFLLRVTRGRQCGGKRGFARTALIVGAVVVGGIVMSFDWHRQGRPVPAVIHLGPRGNVHFGKQASNGDFARIDADEMKEYREQVSRRARMAAARSDVTEAAAPSAEAQPVPPAEPLPAEKPESPEPTPAVQAAPAAAPQAPQPPQVPASPPASLAPPAPPTEKAETTKVQFDAGPLRVEIDTDEETGLPSSEEITRAATTVAAHAVVEAVKHLTRASAEAAKKTAARLTSGSKKPGSKSDTAATEKTKRVATAEAPDAVGSHSTSDGASAGTGNASHVAESISTSSRNGSEERAASAASVGSSEFQPTASASKRPAWVDEPLGKNGAAYRTKIVVGPYKTRQECDQALSQELRLAARTVIDRQVGASNRIPDNRLLPYLSQRVLKEEWEEHKESDTAAVGEMIYLHALLEFDERSWRELARMQHQREIEERVAIVGIGAGWLMALLGTVFGYLKLDTMTRGYYTRRLQLAAGAVILTLVGAAVLPLLK